MCGVAVRPCRQLYLLPSLALRCWCVCVSVCLCVCDQSARKRDLFVDKRDLFVDKRDLFVDKRDLFVDKRDLVMPPTFSCASLLVCMCDCHHTYVLSLLLFARFHIFLVYLLHAHLPPHTHMYTCTHMHMCAYAHIMHTSHAYTYAHRYAG